MLIGFSFYRLAIDRKRVILIIQGQLVSAFHSIKYRVHFRSEGLKCASTISIFKYLLPLRISTIGHPVWINCLFTEHRVWATRHWNDITLSKRPAHRWIAKYGINNLNNKPSLGVFWVKNKHIIATTHATHKTTHLSETLGRSPTDLWQWLYHGRL